MVEMTEQRHRGVRLPAPVREVGTTAVLAVVLYLLVSFCLQTVVVNGWSMEPTLGNRDYLVASKLDYRMGSPHRGDIVVFIPKVPAGAAYIPGGQDLVKRVIGVPGDRVSIANGHVFINGRELSEPYVHGAWHSDPTYGNGRQVVLGPNQYFLMGDNRDHSTDSRELGPQPRERLQLHVLLRLWPLAGMGIVH
jgi:signal peptidase I